MEFERDDLRDIIDIALKRCFGVAYDDVEKYTHYINLLLKLDSLAIDNKIIVIGIKD